MRLMRAILALMLSALLVGLISGVASANVPGVALNAPPPPPAPNVATAGSDVMIKVTATHRDTGTPALHYVDRVALYDGNKLLKEWKYDQNNYKKDEVWTESYTGTANSDMHLRAVAHCTVHGYELTGVNMRVLPRGTKPSDMMQMDAKYAGMQAFGYSDIKKASDYLSSAGSKFLDGIIKAQTNDLKSFQGKLSDWMKSSDGKQFISQRDQQMAPRPTAKMLKATGEPVRQPAMATKKPANITATPPPIAWRTESVYASVKPGGARDIPRVSEIATPTPMIAGKGKGGMVASPKATLKASPTVKYLQARPVATLKASPTAQALKPLSRTGGTVGVAGTTPLTSESRYAARGPGIVDGTMAQPPSSAPGPMASPSARPIVRR